MTNGLFAYPAVSKLGRNCYLRTNATSVATLAMCSRSPTRARPAA